MKKILFFFFQDGLEICHGSSVKAVMILQEFTW